VDQGRAIYVGVLADSDLYEALFDWLLPLLGIESLRDAPHGVEAAVRSGPAGQALFLLNHNSVPVRVSMEEGYLDALTGERVSRQVRLAPRSVKILHGSPA
jgi:hypothetical protein